MRLIGLVTGAELVVRNQYGPILLQFAKHSFQALPCRIRHGQGEGSAQKVFLEPRGS